MELAADDKFFGIQGAKVVCLFLTSLYEGFIGSRGDALSLTQVSCPLHNGDDDDGDGVEE